MAKLNVAVLFGGRSTEHEISIISAVQAMKALNRNKYNVFPVYISKKGVWYLGNKDFFEIKSFKNLTRIQKRAKKILLSLDFENSNILIEKLPFRRLSPLKIDVAIPIFHGKNGEDGSIQGVLETAGIPYTGCDIKASAIGIDKQKSKLIAREAGIPTLESISIQKSSWQNNPQTVLKSISSKFNYPMFIKPAHLGSSIGVSKVHNKGELLNALEVAFCYDSKVLIEKSLENAMEANISILGNNPYELSATEMPILGSEILTFNDKYTSGTGGSKGMASAKRVIPAPLKPSTIKKIENYALKFFSEIEGSGLARIDFLVSRDEKQVYFNEINTIPGSLSFYLWQKRGVSFGRLMDKLIKLALEKNTEKKSLITSFESGILENFQDQKGAKNQ